MLTIIQHTWSDRWPSSTLRSNVAVPRGQLRGETIPRVIRYFRVWGMDGSLSHPHLRGAAPLPEAPKCGLPRLSPPHRQPVLPGVHTALGEQGSDRPAYGGAVDKLHLGVESPSGLLVPAWRVGDWHLPEILNAGINIQQINTPGRS